MTFDDVHSTAITVVRLEVALVPLSLQAQEVHLPVTAT